MDDTKLGCKAYELEVGTEFSCDEGYTWLVVRTEPSYIDALDPDCVTLRFLASDEDNPSLSAWKEVRLLERDHVLLQKNWS